MPLSDDDKRRIEEEEYRKHVQAQLQDGGRPGGARHVLMLGLFVAALWLAVMIGMAANALFAE